nr:ankyrin repeat domain-containing protein [Sphingomonas hankyongi]
MVKKLIFALAAAASLAPVPAAGQQLNSNPTYDFIKAVRDRDGTKANQVLSDHPNVVNSRDTSGDTALNIAVARKDEDWTGFMINNGADVNLPGRGNDTPLIAAARVGFEQAVTWLLQRGAKVDGTNKMGETPLIIAVQQRQARIVKALLDAGANPDKADAAAGLSARDYAKRDSRSPQILQMIDSKKPKAAK